MPVGDVMSVRVVTVAPKAKVQEAIARMLEEGIGSVAVCDGEVLVGMIGIRDVLMRLVEEAAEQRDGARDTARALLARARRAEI